MLTTNFLHKFTKTLATAFAIISLTACSWVEQGEDLTGCPTGDFVVQFVYDYNIQRADMFRDHVGDITLYVFDENGQFVTQREVTDKNLISDRTNHFSIIFRAGDDPEAEEVELLAGRSYHFMALAGQQPNVILDTTGELPAYNAAGTRARYRHSHYSSASHEDDLWIALDREAVLDEEGRYPVSNVAPLDTLWHTLGILPTGSHSTNTKEGWRSNPLVKIREDIYDMEKGVKNHPDDTITISLIRDTKHLHVSLHELGDEPGVAGDVNAEDYDVFITDSNGQMDSYNNIKPGHPLIYRPYHSRTTDMTDAGVAGTTAHYDMMFNRIMYHKEEEGGSQKDAHLSIVRKSDGERVAYLSLPRILAYSRIANDYYNLQEQGYLDREYNYNLSFYLKGGQWESTEIWFPVDVNILSWSVRRQDVEF